MGEHQPGTDSTSGFIQISVYEYSLLFENKNWSSTRKNLFKSQKSKDVVYLDSWWWFLYVLSILLLLFIFWFYCLFERGTNLLTPSPWVRFCHEKRQRHNPDEKKTRRITKKYLYTPFIILWRILLHIRPRHSGPLPQEIIKSDFLFWVADFRLWLVLLHLILILWWSVNLCTFSSLPLGTGRRYK